MKHIPSITFSGQNACRRPECSCGWSPGGNYSKKLAQDIAIRHAFYANKAEEVERGDMERDL